MDELEVLRRLAETVDVLPVGVYQPVKAKLPPPNVAPLAHPIYTLRLALGTEERFCRAAQMSVYDYRNYITGKASPGAARLVGLCLVCDRLGKVDHGHVFGAFLGGVLAIAAQPNEPYRVLWELVRAEIKVTPGMRELELQLYAERIRLVLIAALGTVEPENTTHRARLMEAAIPAVDASALAALLSMAAGAEELQPMANTDYPTPEQIERAALGSQRKFMRERKGRPPKEWAP